jgi:hypothetical protein
VPARSRADFKTKEVHDAVNTNQATPSRLGTVIGRIELGLIIGYLAYLPGLALILFIAYGRIDQDLFFYGLYLPLQLPLLASGSFRENLTANEFLLQSFSVVLIAFTTFIALTMPREQPEQQRSEGTHG